MENRPVGRAPDYTNAALAMGLVNLLWIFCVLWAVFGLPVVILAGLAINRWIHWLRLRREARDRRFRT
jgi:hypothetical protein